MNKKFLFALLFGATAVATTGFVSCKDYDDDIAELRDQIKSSASLNDLKAQVEILQNALNTKITSSDAEAAVKAAQQATLDEVRAMLANLNAEDLAAQFAEITAKINVVSTDLGAEIAAVKSELGIYISANDQEVANLRAEMEAQKLALEEFKQNYSLDALTETIEAIKNALGKCITKEQLEAAKAELSPAIDNIDTALNMLLSQLKSLVFRPAFYFHGIEAMEATGYEYGPVDRYEDVDPDTDDLLDHEVAGGSLVKAIPTITAEYNLNPSNARLENVVWSWDVINAKFTTRANEVSPVVTGVTRKANGNMLVTSRIFEDASHFINTNVSTDDEGDVTVMALEAQYGDTIITSDYAAIKSSYYNGFELSLNHIADHDCLDENATTNSNKSQIHMYETAKDAAENDPQATVAWNSEIDLAKIINTHFNTAANATGAERRLDENANDGKAKAKGFTYSYELVGWFKGGNATSESAHAFLKTNTETGNSSILHPQMTVNGKAVRSEGVQNEATIGREPIVRVILTDNDNKNNNGKNYKASVGYIKVRIVDDVVLPPVVEPNVYEYKWTNKYTLSCAHQSFYNELVWWQIEEQILADLNISKSDFESQYKINGGVYGVETPNHFFNGQEGYHDVDQFNAATNDATKLTTEVGEVCFTDYDKLALETNVISWKIDAAQAYAYFYTNKKTEMSTLIRFTKTYTVDANILQHHVYVKLVWAPEPINITPSGNLFKDESDKISNFWYKGDEKLAETGFDNFHIYMDEPTNDANAPKYIAADALDVFFGHDFNINDIDVATYPDFADNKLTKELIFSDVNDGRKAYGASGKTYTLEAVGQELYAYRTSLVIDGQLIATVENNPSWVEHHKYNPAEHFIRYQHGEYSEDILNRPDELTMVPKFPHVTLQVKATNGCDYLPLVNDTIAAKFVKPVFVTDPQDNVVYDAVDGNPTAKLNLNFYDWRDRAFQLTPINYFTYYEVNKIEAKLDEIKTNLGQTDKTKFVNLLSVTGNTQYFGFDEATASQIAAKDFGTIVYYNERNNTGVNEFQIILPVTIHYVWGKFDVQVKVTVKNTIGGNAAREM